MPYAFNPFQDFGAGGLDVTLEEVPGEPNGFVDETDATLSFTDGTRTLEIAPAVTSFDFYANGIKFTKTAAEDIVITDTEGLHYIYYDDTGTLQTTTTFSSDLIKVECLVSIIYWDADNNKAIYVANEKHHLMQGYVHFWIHTYERAQYKSGLALENFTVDDTGNDDTHAQFSSASGEIVDEDIEHTIAASANPGQFPILYKDGAAGNWRQDAAGNFACKSFVGGSSRLAWNELTGGVWQQTEVGQNNFVLVHLFATNDDRAGYQVVAVQGQAEYSTVIAARTGATTEINALVVLGLPFVEFVAIGTVIFQTSTGYSNTPQARVRSTDEGDDYVNFRAFHYSPTAGPNDHGALAGLLDDDHTQYLLIDGSRAMTGSLLVDGGNIGITTDADLIGLANQAVTLTAQTITFQGATGALRFTESNGDWTLRNMDDDEFTLFQTSKGGVAYNGFLVEGAQWGRATFYYNNTAAFRTTAGGLEVGPTSTGGKFWMVGNDFYHEQTVHGGRHIFRAEDTGGVTRNQAIFDPDGGLDFYYTGVKVLSTYLAAGANEAGLQITGEDQTRTALLYLDDDNDSLRLKNQAVSGKVHLMATDSGSVVTNVVIGDPDGAVDLYYDASIAAQTRSGGFTLGASATSAIFESGTDLYFSSTTHGGAFIMQSEDTGGVLRVLGTYDPDGACNFYYAGVKVLSTHLAAGANEAGLRITSEDGTLTAEFVLDDDNDAIRFRNNATSGNLIFTGKDSGAANSNVIAADPDAGVTLYYDGSAVFVTTATGITVASEIGIAADDDLLSLASGALTINGDLRVEGQAIGTAADTDIISLGTNLLTINGKLVAEKDTGGTYDSTTVAFVAGDADGGDSTYIIGNTINCGLAYNAAVSLWLNYRGYDGGNTQFRDLIIGDGKATQIAKWTGSNGRFQLLNGVAIDEFSSDGTMAGNSDLAVPTEAAVVTFVSGHVGTGTGAGDYGVRDNAGVMEYKDSGGSWTTFVSLSDIRLKENIQDYDVGLDFILELQPKQFNFKTKPEDLEHGLIAQDVRHALNSLGIEFSGWYERPDGLQGIRYKKFIVPLINAIKEQADEIQNLRDDLEELRSELLG